TMLYTDQTYQVQLSPGLNFACYLTPNGLLGAIEKSLPLPKQLTLAGPIILSLPSQATDPLALVSWPPTNLTTPLWGINLRADLQIDLPIEQMTLKDIFIVCYSPLADEVPGIHYDPGIFLGGTLQIGQTFSVEVVAEKTLGIDNLLTLSGKFDGLSLPSLSQFAALVGGDDLLNSLV